MKSPKEVRKCFEPNDNENAIYPDLWNTAKTMFRDKFLALKFLC
jgi:hypothetical protein